MRFLSLKAVMVWGVFLLLTGLLTGFTVERFVENTHYRLIPGGTATSTPEVVEFFSYGCPHCRSIEADFEAWLAAKPKNVKVMRVPAAWNPRFETLARFYLTLDEMGDAEKYSAAIFKAIHEENKKLASKDEIVGYVSALGIDSKRFADTYDSDKVSQRLEESKQLFAQYRLSGVPGFVVNGQYFTDITMGGHGQGLFDVINFLISK